MSEIMFITKKDEDEFVLLGDKVPEIGKFSDFITDNYIHTYHDFIGFGFRNRLLPFGGNEAFYYEECSHVNTEILRVHVNRIDQLSARINTVVKASFSNGKNTYKFTFRVEGTLKTSERCNFFENVYPFRKADIPEENLLSDYLVPYLCKNNLDTEAETILQKFYPEALYLPVPVDGRKLAENMGFKLMKARLSLDNSKFGSIFFNDTEVTIYKGETPVTRTVPANTILLDIEAQEICCMRTGDIIVHECVHAYEHYMFFWFQSEYRSKLKEIPLPLEDITSRAEKNSPLEWIENQANHITPRICMPLAQTAIKATELMEKYSKYPDSIAYSKVIEELAEFYDVSKHTARNRLKELGYRDAENIGRFANGKPVPGYKSNIRTEWNQTFIIDFDKLVKEYTRNAAFRELLDYGDYIYVEGHLCRNSEKYIWTRNGEPCLSGYARNNIDECCLMFTIRHEAEDYEYIPGVLNKESRKGELSYLYVTEYATPVHEAMAVRKINEKIPDDFSETIVYHMHNLGMSRDVLAERSMLSVKTISRMRNSGRRNYSTRNIIAVCVGMNLFPELSHDLLKKADINLHNDVPEEMCYQVMLRSMYRENIYKWNEILILQGFPPLMEDNHSADTNNDIAVNM